VKCGEIALDAKALYFARPRVPDEATIAVRFTGWGLRKGIFSALQFFD
jgi:hypothetical protein